MHTTRSGVRIRSGFHQILPQYNHLLLSPATVHQAPRKTTPTCYNLRNFDCGYLLLSLRNFNVLAPATIEIH